MARTKQTVRDNWEQKRAGKLAETGAEAGETSVEPLAAETSKDVPTKVDEPLAAVCESDHDEEGEEEEYEVECIVGERMHRRKRQYMVKWVSFEVRHSDR